MNTNGAFGFLLHHRAELGLSPAQAAEVAVYERKRPNGSFDSAAKQLRWDLSLSLG